MHISYLLLKYQDAGTVDKRNYLNSGIYTWLFTSQAKFTENTKENKPETQTNKCKEAVNSTNMNYTTQYSILMACIIYILCHLLCKEFT